MSFQKIVNNLFNHLLAIHTAAYTLGIAASSQYIMPIVPTLHYGVVPSAVLALFLLFTRKKRFIIAAVSLLLFFIAGYYHGLVSSKAPGSSAHLYNLVSGPTDVVITGRLQSMPSFDGTTSRVVITVDALQTKKQSSLNKARGKVLLRMRFAWPKTIEPGARVAIRTLLHPPSRYHTPGVFDYPAYLARKGIWITGYIDSPAQITAINHNPPIEEVITYLPERLRTRIGNLLDVKLPKETGSLYRALLLGDRSRVSPQVLEAFKLSGTMHILAISGIHMSLISALLFTFFYWLLRRSTWLILRINTRKAAGILCLPLLICYAMLAGLNTPVLRACIISCIIIFAFCVDRPKTVSSLIAMAVLILLATNPQTLFTVSFQLTFAAFCSIMMSIPVLKKYIWERSLKENTCRKGFRYICHWAFSGFIASAAAVLGTAPVLIYHFHQLPLIGAVTNLIIEPLICLWALPFGFLALPFLFFVPDIALLLLQIGGIGLKLGLMAAQFFSVLPYTVVYLPPPHPAHFLCYYAALFWAFLFLRHPQQRKISHSFAIITFAIIVVALNFSTPSLLWKREIKNTTVHFLDVGQGSAALVEFAGGKTILIDGGGPSFDNGSVGQSVIAPFLWQKNITRLDAIIITHPDSDHYNGIPFLLEQFTPEILWSSTDLSQSQSYQGLLHRAEQLGVKVKIPKKGDQLLLDEIPENESIAVLANLSDHNHANTNNSGLVVSLTVSGTISPQNELPNTDFQIIFPGDISKTMELDLMDNVSRSKKNILLASHHGSASSNCRTFLEHITPDLIITSSGRSKREYFPSKMLRDYCETHDIPLLVTAEHGTIRITVDKGVPRAWVEESTTNPLRRNHNWVQPQRVFISHAGGEDFTPL